MSKERPLPQSLHLPCTGVDSHAHLDSKPLLPDFEGVLSRATAAGIAHIGQVFLSSRAYRELAPRFAQHAQLFFLLGIHPTDCHEVQPDELAQVEALLREDSPKQNGPGRIRALGEIGLDFYWKECPPETQYQFFRAQLHLARELELPVVIHSRDAFAQTLAVLDELHFSGYPLLWHCFGGNTAEAAQLISRGWHISVPGPVTYPNNIALREAIATVPADRLLLETDCPYLAPQSWRGQLNEPALCAFTAACVAEIRNVPVADLWTQCGHNARRFFHLPEFSGNP